MRIKFIRIGVMLVGLSVATSSVYSMPLIEPLLMGNRHPLMQAYGLPDAMINPTEKGEQQLNISLNIASHFSNETNHIEQVMFDGEMLCLGLHWNLGLTDEIDLKISVPYLQHSGGFLDNFINQWHRLFGLPSNRPLVANNQLRYFYANNQERFLLTERGGGLGDTKFEFGKRMKTKLPFIVGVRGVLKLPTGNEQKLLGSGSTDIYLGTHASGYWGERFNWYANLGVMWMSDSPILPKTHKSIVWQHTSGVGWLINPNIHLKMQIETHSPFYRSNLKVMGAQATQLAVGGTIQLSKTTQLELSVSEDVAVDTNPDVVFQIQIKTALPF